MSKPLETHAETPAVAAKHGGRLLAPARYRHPGDVIRLILAGLALAGAAAVTVACGVPKACLASELRRCARMSRST